MKIENVEPIKRKWEQPRYPFNKRKMLRTSMFYAKRSITTSIDRTLSYQPEFNGDSEKSKEILDTLTVLYAMKKLLDEFQENNSKYFEGE
jgi:hypothetical protein